VVPFWHRAREVPWSDSAGERPGGASAVRLSKSDGYLADKFCVLMLSEVVGGVQGEIELAVDPVPDLGISGKPG
jgi:hypothetical protein